MCRAGGGALLIIWKPSVTRDSGLRTILIASFLSDFSLGRLSGSIDELFRNGLASSSECGLLLLHPDQHSLI